MSYPYSSTGGHPNYTYPTATYTPHTASVPQYTQSQINEYYQRWHCYPPEPFTIIQDTAAYVAVQPAQQVTVASYPAISSAGATFYGQGAGGSGSSSVESTMSSGRTRTWTCDFPTCTSTANFTRLADLQRHQATVHGGGAPDFPCTVRGCNRVAEKGFTRRDHLVEHLRNYHHLDIPKRRPGERSANPLGLPGYYQGS